MSTVIRQLKNPADFSNPNIVKVVVDSRGQALYFSRSLIPYPRNIGHCPVYEHIGLYVYRKAFLLEFITWPPTPLEITESLEQLRVLENGRTIQTVETDLGYGAPCIDTPEDLEKARAYLEAHS
jgi:3-deoxy-manno-octulosonate cytidylyltransferase (CMP-KDO synthetase)